MIQIAIDGPSGAGKSTVAKAVARELGIIYVDTGALYRTVGYFVRSRNVNPKDPEGVAALLPEISVELKYENGRQIVCLNGEDLGDRIRALLVAMATNSAGVGDHTATLLCLVSMGQGLTFGQSTAGAGFGRGAGGILPFMLTAAAGQQQCQ